MANCLVLILVLLYLKSTVGNVPFQQCCPEDDEHVFLRRDHVCNSSRTLGIVCENESDVNTFLNTYKSYWLREKDGSVIIGSEFAGMVLARESFCVGKIAFETTNNSDVKYWQVEEGIVTCNAAEFNAMYLGPEPLSYSICILLSGIGCFITFLTYAIVPALRRDLLNKCLICALLSFSVTYLTLGITIFEAHRLPHRFCSYQISFIFFWATASLFWTNAISFDVWRSVAFRRFILNEAQLLKVYYFWGWGMPVILCLVGLLLEYIFFWGFGEDCLVESIPLTALIMISALILFFFNLLYFIWTICKLWRQAAPNSPGIKVTRLQRLRYKCLLYLKLFLVMGIPWIVRIVTVFLPGNAFTRISLNILVILQGLFVFLLLVVFRKKAWLGLAEQFAKWGCPCPFVTTNFAVTLHDEGDDDDDDSEAERDEVELNAQRTTSAS